MQCPSCNYENSSNVLKTTKMEIKTNRGTVWIKRRYRNCLHCGFRYWTQEHTEMLIKHGSIEK